MSIAIDFGQLITADDKAVAARHATRSAIAARRWDAEVGGMTFAGMRIHTDDRTKTQVLGAYQEAMEDPAYTVQWKVADGAFVTLDAATIIAVAKAIRAHVQSCFEREAQLLRALDDGDPYDIEEGWP